MIIRKATKDDFNDLYELGKKTPEFKVSSSSEFMEADEFLAAINDPEGVFLIAEDQCLLGFIYASYTDIERGPKTKWACLVYLTVDEPYRGSGIATGLYHECIHELKKHSVTKVYGWASVEGDRSIISFMEKQGFATGHQYAWVDKEI